MANKGKISSSLSNLADFTTETWIKKIITSLVRHWRDFLSIFYTLPNQRNMLLSHVERVSDLGIKNDTELKMVLSRFFMANTLHRIASAPTARRTTITAKLIPYIFKPHDLKQN